MIRDARETSGTRIESTAVVLFLCAASFILLKVGRDVLPSSRHELLHDRGGIYIGAASFGLSMLCAMVAVRKSKPWSRPIAWIWLGAAVAVTVVAIRDAVAAFLWAISVSA